MTLFWISTIILSLAAVVLIVLPFVNKKANNDEALRDELNKAFYKDRLDELEVEAEAGLVDQLTMFSSNSYLYTISSTDDVI